MAAHFIDLAACGSVWLGLSVLSAEVAGAFDVSVDSYRTYFGSWLDAAGVPLVFVADLVVLPAATGYTVGKRALGLRVVAESGERPGLKRAAVRALPLVIEQLGLFALWAMRRDPRNRRFGDRWAGTLVIRS